MNYYQLAMALLLFSISLYAFYARMRMESSIHSIGIKPGRKTFLVEPLHLPFIIIILLLFLLLQSSLTPFLNYLGLLMMLFINLSIYYGIVLLLLPLLRKTISARACAYLWMIPTTLYALTGPLYLGKPRIFLTLPQRLFKPFVLIWFIGVLVVLLYFFISHLLFRKNIVKDGKKLMDEQILSLWRKKAKKYGVKEEIPILLSDEVNTPFTLGLFEKSMILFLPRKEYNQEELTLIFDHELLHIARSDTRTKLFLDFFAAVTWFNPLSLIARKKTAQDLELSCDETLLNHADERTRSLYAELLLKNAGSSPGYTTCLSAAASTLRYRLKNVVKPSRRYFGGLVVSIAIFLLVMSLGALSLTEDRSTIKEKVFDPIPMTFRTIQLDARGLKDQSMKDIQVYAWKEKELQDYLSSLPVKKIYSRNDLEVSSSPSITLIYSLDTEDPAMVKNTVLSLNDVYLTTYQHFWEKGKQVYLVDDAIDWDYIKTLLDFDAEERNSNPLATTP